MLHKERQKQSIYDINFKPIVKAQIMNTAISKDIGQLRWSHTMRVVKIATKLADRMPEKLDIRKVRVMCILHDMYKYVEYKEDSHGDSAAEYLRSILNAYLPDDPLSNEWIEWSNVIHAIACHSIKDNDEKYTRPYLAILQDADVLDKLSIGWIWYTNKLFASDEPVEVTAEYYKSKVAKYKGATPGYQELYENALKILDSGSWYIPSSKKASKKYGIIKKGK